MESHDVERHNDDTDGNKTEVDLYYDGTDCFKYVNKFDQKVTDGCRYGNKFDKKNVLKVLTTVTGMIKKRLTVTNTETSLIKK